MTSLRWRYKIRVNVEETGEAARKKGFSVIRLEGQSRTNEELYPLNQIKIKSGNFAPNFNVILSPRTQQIYSLIKEIEDVGELEQVLGDLENTEQVLNETVIFAPNEASLFGLDTRIPIMSPGMLKTQRKLTGIAEKAIDDIIGLVLSEITQAFMDIAQGRFLHGKKRIEIFLHELVNMQRNLIQMLRDQNIEEAKKREKELDKLILTSKRFDVELASAQSPAEINEILKRYWAIFKKHGGGFHTSMYEGR